MSSKLQNKRGGGVVSLFRRKWNHPGPFREKEDIVEYEGTIAFKVDESTITKARFCVRNKTLKETVAASSRRAHGGNHRVKQRRSNGRFSSTYRYYGMRVGIFISHLARNLRRRIR